MDANGLLSYSFANHSSNVAIGQFSLVPEAV